MPRVHTEVDIDAPVELVWSVLTDFDNYRDWHPSIAGVAVYGPLMEHTKGSLSVRTKPGAAPSRVDMVLTEVEPGRALCWKGGVGPEWLARGFHYHYLEPLASGGTRLVQGETFTGLMFRLLWPLLRTRLGDEYQRVRGILKQRCEGLHGQS